MFQGDPTLDDAIQRRIQRLGVLVQSQDVRTAGLYLFIGALSNSLQLTAIAKGGGIGTH